MNKLVLLLFGFLIISGCASQTPIVIFVTPTPQEVVLADGPIIGSAPTEVVIAVVVTPTAVPIAPTKVPIELASEKTLNLVSSPLNTNATPLLDSSQMGIQIDANFATEDWSAVLALAQQTKVTWIKLQLSWKFLQPDFRGQFDQNFRVFEMNLQAAKRMGFNILVSIAKAPDWARTTSQFEDGPPDDPQDLADFIGLLLLKLNDSIDAIEIWNEPNLRREWQGGLEFNGAGYMELFRVAYDAIRAVNPSPTIVTAGLAPTGTSAGSMNDREFLQQMYDAGLGRYRDIFVGIHPYSWGNSPDARCCDRSDERGWDDNPHFFFADTLHDYRTIMNRRGHAGVQLWVTEFGWATWEGFPNQPIEPWVLYNSADDQLQYTLRAFEIGQTREDIGMMFLWNLNFANDYAIENQHEQAGYSLIYPPLDSGLSIQVRQLYDALRYRP